MEVLREREMRESLEKQLQEEHKNRILMQKRCAKLKKLRRKLQERLDIEVVQRKRKENESVRSATPDTMTEVNCEYQTCLTLTKIISKTYLFIFLDSNIHISVRNVL